MEIINCHVTAPAISRPPSRARHLAPAISRPPSRARHLAPAISRLNSTFLLALTFLFTSGCLGHAAPASLSALPWDSGKQGGFVTALCADRRGDTFVGTEDNGLWRWDGHAWTQFTAESPSGGPGDNDIYSLACDRLGRLWCGTDRSGVSVYADGRWQTYGPLDGPLGSHVTALAVSPKDGSVWMGSELGIARYRDGWGWRYWTRADGLPADQITCLAFAKDGTLYVGTDCDGLAVGSPRNDFKVWRHIPGPLRPADQGRGRGLPSALVNCLLVGRTGTIYCGTNAGLAWSSNGGRAWVYRRGGDWLDKGAGTYNNGLTDNAKLSGLEVSPLHPRHGERGFAIAAAGGAAGLFLAPRGFTGGQVWACSDAIDTRGVPSPAPQVVYQNERWGTFSWAAQHLVPGASYHVRLHFAECAHDGPGQRVFSVFCNGLPVLEHFDIFRAAGGKDRAIVKGFPARADGLGRLTLAFQGAGIQGTSSPADLLEDYVTALAEDGQGRLWVSHRQAGLEALDERTGARVWPGPKDVQPSDYIASLLPTAHGLCVGEYGDGLGLLTLGSVAPGALRVATQPASLPFPAAAPTEASLRGMLGRITRLTSTGKNTTQVAYLGPDWATQGDWVGRYGRQYAVLFAARSPIDHEIISDPSYHVAAMVGPHCGPDEGLRHWVQWVHTDDPRVLYDPIPGYRRESEADDHGESYPATYEGPDVWARITVPAGIHRVSLYFMNKDGHDWNNRFRDYLVEIKPDRKTVAEAQDAPVLARARVHGFWQGEYTQFAVSGPASYWVRVDKNFSLNVILQSVMLDRLDGPPVRFQQNRMPWMGDYVYAAPNPSDLLNAQQAPSGQEYVQQVCRLAHLALSSRLAWIQGGSLQQPTRLYVLRLLTQQHTSADWLRVWRWGYPRLD